MLQSIKRGIGNLGVKLIKFTARKAKIDLLKLGYWENGILKSHTMKASGEDYFIKTYLPKHLKQNKPVFFDVGANKGIYSTLLNETFPSAEIYAFEPNIKTFEVLQKNLPENVRLINQGIGENPGELALFYDAKDETSVQATSDPEILKVIAKTTEITEVKIGITTLDDFCETNNISSIDLLKIDTEGFELEALKGAKEMFKKGAIAMVQFEFNEVNIVKRRFLRDFYEILPGFEFYRLDENRMIPLEEWKPIHEIFMFQNIVAIKKANVSK